MRFLEVWSIDWSFVLSLSVCFCRRDPLIVLMLLDMLIDTCFSL